MAFYFYLSTKIIMVFITKSYQDLFGVRSYINARKRGISARCSMYLSFYGSLYLFHVFLLSESMMISIHFVPIATGKVGYGNRCISVFYRKTGQVGHTAPFC